MRNMFAALVLIGPGLDMPAVADHDNSKSSWPQWRGVNRDGHSQDRGLLQEWSGNAPNLVWKVKGLGDGYAGVAVTGDRIFTTGNQGNGQAIICLDRETGAQLWQTPLTKQDPNHGYKGSRSTPTIDGDRAYVVTSDGQIVCVTTDDGKVVWQRDFAAEFDGKMMSGWGFSESPLIDGDRVVFTPGGRDAMLVAADKFTGRTIWQSDSPPDEGQGKPGAGYSSIAVSEGAGVRQYVQLVGRGVIGVRADDGKLLWTYNRVANGTANIPSPVPIGDFIFCSSGYGTGAALLKLETSADEVTANEQYFLKPAELQNHHGGMVLVGDYVYCGHGHNNGVPRCIHVLTGKRGWQKDIAAVGKGSAAVAFADNHLIYRYESGEVALVEARPDEYILKGAFRPVFQKGKSWAHPVVSGGRLYLREQDVLMCYDLTAQP